MDETETPTHSADYGPTDEHRTVSVMRRCTVCGRPFDYHPVEPPCDCWDTFDDDEEEYEA